MSLRLKIYLIVGFVLVAGAAALFMVSQTLVMNGFDRLEVDDVRGKVALVRTMLDRELTDLGTIATGYCSGARRGPLGSLEFLGGEAGPGDSSFAGGGVSVAVLVGADGQTVISRRFDGKTGVADHTPSELSPYVQPESPWYETPVRAACCRACSCCLRVLCWSILGLCSSRRTDDSSKEY